MKLKLLNVLFFLVSIWTNNIYAQFSSNSFASKVDFAAPSNVQGLNYGDLNNDGKQDIISANIGNNTLTIYVNVSSSNIINTSSFVSFNLTTLSAQPQQVAVGDLNNDGKLDLVVGYSNTSASQFSVFVNNSTGVGLAPSSFSRQDFTAGSAPAGVAIADFDRDGKNDIVTTAYGGSSIYVFRNTSLTTSISLASASIYSVGVAPSAVTVGDLDRDGKTDIVVSNYSSNTISILKNNSPFIGTFSFSGQIIATPTAPYWIRLSDYNNDSLLDISVSCYYGPSVANYRNTSSIGSISMATRYDLSVSPNSATQANFSTDLNGDGMNDLAVTVASSPTILVYKNIYTGGIFNATMFTSATGLTIGAGPVGLISVDLDNDMRPDLVGASYTNSYISILKNLNLSPEPTLAASNLSSSFAGGVLTLNLSKGNGRKRMVVGRLASNAAVAPTDTNVYLAKDTFGLGQNLGSDNFVLYADTGRVVQIKGLTGSNTYVFSVYEYNGYGGFSNYYQAGAISTSVSTNDFFYSKSSGNINLTSSWGSNTDGSGTAPASFNLPNTTFVVANNSSPTLSANWVVTGSGSFIQVGDGTNALNFIVPTGMSVFTDSISVKANATITFLGGIITNKSFFDSLSTVQFVSSNAQNIPGNNYYNIVVAGGVKTLLNNTFVRGSLNMLTSIQTGTYTITLGVSPSFPGTLNRSNGTIIGKFARYYAPSISAGTAGILPIGTATSYRQAKLEFTSAPTVGGLVTAEFISSNPGNSGLPLYDFSMFPLIEINKAANSGYWKITSAGLTGGTYTLTLNAAGFYGVSAVADLRIIKRQPAGAWVTQGTAVAGTGTTSNPEVARTGMSGLGEFTIGGDSTVNPLPVSWLSFEGKMFDGSAHLFWKTAFEKNNQKFEIERKELGASAFENIGSVKASNSNTMSSYVFDDYQVTINGTYIYRIKQIDFDGSFSYSKEIVLGEFGSNQGLILYPNPAKEYLIIAQNQDFLSGTCKAISVEGKMFELNINGNLLDISGLNSGLYMLIGPDNKEISRFIKE